MNQENLIKLLCFIYNSGYQNGHHHTVESYFTDVHYNDFESYHEDVVVELLEEFMKSKEIQ